MSFFASESVCVCADKMACITFPHLFKAHLVVLWKAFASHDINTQLDSAGWIEQQFSETFFKEKLF